MPKITSDTNLSEYRAILQEEHDLKQRLCDEGEARLPELKANLNASAADIESYRTSVRANGGFGNGEDTNPQQIELNRLLSLRQGHYDVLTTCEREFDRARPRLAELERLLGADAAIAQLTDRYGSEMTAASAAERKVQNANDMITAIDADKVGRAERRQQIADSNATAQIEHAEAALLARSEGKPVPEAPAAKRLANGEESDADLDSQRSAAIRLRDKYSDELRALVDNLVAMRAQLTRARFDAADLRVRAALFSIRNEITEYEAERQASGYLGSELEIQLDDIAVRARANEIVEEIPVWRPMAKAARHEQAGDTAPNEAMTSPQRDAPALVDSAYVEQQRETLEAAKRKANQPKARTLDQQLEDASRRVG
jgi:hypothetical protein